MPAHDSLLCTLTFSALKHALFVAEIVLGVWWGTLLYERTMKRRRE